MRYRLRLLEKLLLGIFSEQKKLDIALDIATVNESIIILYLQLDI